MTPVRAGTRPGIEPPTRAGTYDPAPAWQDRAACREHDPETFYPVGTGHEAKAIYEEARIVCRGCDVRPQCLVAGESEVHGMWGGTTPEERGYKTTSGGTSRRKRK